MRFLDILTNQGLQSDGVYSIKGWLLRRKHLFCHDAQDKLHSCHKSCHGNQHVGHINTEEWQSERKVIRRLNPVNEEVQRGKVELSQGPVF